jgi:nicotinamide-nucleotide amidase
MFDESLSDRARAILLAAEAKGWLVATAESCTGGLIAACLTEIPGSSAVVERGFVTYSNEAKTEMLGVPAEMIARVGAVSEEVAQAMAAGALARSRAHLAVSVTGVAGPGGGTRDKPVGRVHLALAGPDDKMRHRKCDFGDIGRQEVRIASLAVAFELLEQALDIGR